MAGGAALGATGALAVGVADKAASAYGAFQSRLQGAASGGTSGTPPSYERMQEDTSRTPWMHRGSYGEGASPIVVNRGSGGTAPSPAVSYSREGGVVTESPGQAGPGGPAPVATERWANRGAYEHTSGRVVEGPPPPGRWTARGEAWITEGEKGGEE